MRLVREKIKHEVRATGNIQPAKFIRNPTAMCNNKLPASCCAPHWAATGALTALRAPLLVVLGATWLGLATVALLQVDQKLALKSPAEAHA